MTCRTVLASLVALLLAAFQDLKNERPTSMGLSAAMSPTTPRERRTKRSPTLSTTASFLVFVRIRNVVAVLRSPSLTRRALKSAVQNCFESPATGLPPWRYVSTSSPWRTRCAWTSTRLWRRLSASSSTRRHSSTAASTRRWARSFRVTSSCPRWRRGSARSQPIACGETSPLGSSRLLNLLG